MALAITTVTASIAALSVTGLSIRDVDNIPVEVLDRMCPILYPEPVDFIGNFEVTPMSFGTAGSGYFDVDYTLRYAFAFMLPGSVRGSLSRYKEFVQLWEDLWDKIIISDNISGCVSLIPAGNVSFGPILDPSSNPVIGSHVLFGVKEFE